jgi:hypothetical protein
MELLSLFGFGVSSVANAVLLTITKWVAVGATGLLTELASALNAATPAPINAGFLAEYAVIERLGLELVLPLLLACVIQAVVLGDGRLLVRAVLLKVPAALLLSSALLELVSLSLSVTDAMSSAVLASTGDGAGQFIGSVAGSLTFSDLTQPVFGGFVALFLCVVACLVAFFLWVELVIRSAALSVALLFIPLALAGVVWPATAHWARRLGEVIASLVLSKLVIVAVIAIAVTSLGPGTGPTTVVEGIALIGLASFMPFCILRLIPLAEAHAIAHLEGIGHRAMASGRSAVGAAQSLMSVSEAREAQQDLVEDDPIPFLEGNEPEGPEFEQLVQEIHSELRDPSEYDERGGSLPEEDEFGHDD